MMQCVIHTLHHIFYATTSVGHKKSKIQLCGVYILGDALCHLLSTYYQCGTSDDDAVRNKHTASYILHYYQRWTSEALTAISKYIMGGSHFGNLAKMRHIITYSLSPFEQKAFANFFSKGIPNTLRRISSQILTVAPPFVIVYIVYGWGTRENERLKRKNPSLYANDQ